MAKVVSASDASRRLASLLDEVHGSDAAFVIERDGQPAAALVPVGLLERLVRGAASDPADGAGATDERPIDRIAALRAMMAEPSGGERFEAVLQRTFASVRKQRRRAHRSQALH